MTCIIHMILADNKLDSFVLIGFQKGESGQHALVESLFSAGRLAPAVLQPVEGRSQSKGGVLHQQHHLVSRPRRLPSILNCETLDEGHTFLEGGATRDCFLPKKAKYSGAKETDA